MQNRLENELGVEPIGKLLLKYSAPAIISMLVQAVYNLINRLFVGNIEGIGAMAITGIGVTVPATTIMLAFSILIAAGAATNMSIKLGEGNVDDARKLVGNAMSLAVILGGLLTVSYLLFGDQALKAFGAEGESFYYAKEYMNYLVIGIVPWFLSMAMGFCMRADGSPRRAAIIMVIGALLNIPLDVIFILWLGMGVKGAGLATSIAEIITMILTLEYYIRGKSNIKFTSEYLKPDLKTLKMIFYIGMTPFVINLAMSLSQIITNNELRIYGGELAIGAMTTISTIVLIFFMPLIGLTQGMQPIVGYNYGARKLDRAKRAFQLTTIAGTILFVIAIIFTLVLPEYIVVLFNRDPELLALTIDGIRKDTFTLPIVALSVVGSTYMLSIGKAHLAMFLSLLRQIVVLIPALIILPKFLGLDGVWFAQPVSDVVSMIIVSIVLIREFKTYKRV